MPRAEAVCPHRFRKWVTSEVLPAIRRTGGYTATETSPAAAGGAADFQVTIPFHHYNDLLQSLIQKQEKIATLEAELGRRAFTGVARVLIQETSLSDEEIARSMEGILGDYLPEWVAWQRRRLQGSRLS